MSNALKVFFFYWVLHVILWVMNQPNFMSTSLLLGFYILIQAITRIFANITSFQQLSDHLPDDIKTNVSVLTFVFIFAYYVIDCSVATVLCCTIFCHLFRNTFFWRIQAFISELNWKSSIHIHSIYIFCLLHKYAVIWFKYKDFIQILELSMILRILKNI